MSSLSFFSWSDLSGMIHDYENCVWGFERYRYTMDMITQKIDTSYMLTPAMIRKWIGTSVADTAHTRSIRSTREFLRRADIHAVSTIDGKGFNSATDIDTLLYG